MTLNNQFLLLAILVLVGVSDALVRRGAGKDNPIAVVTGTQTVTRGIPALRNDHIIV